MRRGDRAGTPEPPASRSPTSKEKPVPARDGDASHRWSESGQGDHPGGRGAQHGVADRHGRAPAAAKASSSASVMPPSGPMMIMTSPDVGSGTSAIGCVASSCSTRARSTRRSGRPAARWSRARSTSGTRSRRDCLAASRTVRTPALQGLLGPIPRPADDGSGGLPGHDLVDAQLGQHLDGQLGPVALGQRLHGDEADRRAGLEQLLARPRRSARTCRPTTTGPRTPRARPSRQHDASPRRGSAAPPRRAGPRRRPAVTVVPIGGQRPGQSSIRKSGSVTGRRTRPAAGRRRPGPCFCTVTSGRVSSRSSASWRSSSRCSSSIRVGVWTSSVTPSWPRPLERSRGTPLPSSAIRVPDWVPDGTVTRTRRRPPVGVLQVGLEGRDADLGAQRGRRSSGSAPRPRGRRRRGGTPRAGRRPARRTGRRPGRRRGRPRRARPGGCGCRC